MDVSKENPLSSSSGDRIIKTLLNPTLPDCGSRHPTGVAEPRFHERRAHFGTPQGSVDVGRNQSHVTQCAAVWPVWTTPSGVGLTTEKKKINFFFLEDRRIVVLFVVTKVPENREVRVYRTKKPDLSVLVIFGEGR